MNILDRVNLHSFENISTNQKSSFERSLKKDYYNLTKENWDKPYNREIRNALFNEPFIHPKNRPLSFSDFQPESYEAMWQRQYVQSNTVSTPKAVRIYLQEFRRIRPPDDYYSSCLSSKGAFMSYLNDNTICTFANSKPLTNRVLPSKMKGAITALQIDDKGTNYFGTWFGACYSYSIESDSYRQFISPSNESEQICSMALDNNLLYTSSKSRSLTITSLKEGTTAHLSFEHPSDFACRILPPYKSNHSLALGLNSNLISIFDDRNLTKTVYTHRLHKATVRALAWNPDNSSELASGGGLGDKKIHVWNINTGELKDEIFTDAQICNLFWTKWKGESYLASINGYGKRVNSGEDVNSAIHIYKWKNNKLQFNSNYTFNYETRPLHSSIDEMDCHNLMVAGENYFYKVRLFDSELKRTPKNNIKALEEKFTIR